MKKILVSYFEPFGGRAQNSSLVVAEQLEGVDRVCLPVVFGQAWPHLKQEIDRTEPEIVLALGQAEGRDKVTVERVAINIRDTGMADNSGHTPEDEPLEASGPPAVFSSLPIKDLVKVSLAAGVPTAISNTAGTYVCNGLMYHLGRWAQQQGRQAGFIHLPLMPEQVVGEDKKPAMDVALMVRSLNTMIQHLRGE